jgi:peptidylprolyl isomerase
MPVLGLALAVAIAHPALAQKQSQEDEARQAEMSRRAEEDAARLRAEQAAGKEHELKAVVAVDPANVWDLELSNGGKVRIQLRPDVAPQHVERIKTLTRQHFYDGLAFHRVIDGFMAQGGDPKGDGTGGSTLPDLKQEFNWLPHVRGAVAMARAESEDSANSQFFIMLMPRLQLDHKYTVFGRVIDGMATVDAIARGEPPENPTRIVRAALEQDDAAAAPTATPPAAPAEGSAPPQP